jgi:hypothetical protein
MEKELQGTDALKKPGCSDIKSNSTDECPYFIHFPMMKKLLPFHCATQGCFMLILPLV